MNKILKILSKWNCEIGNIEDIHIYKIDDAYIAKIKIKEKEGYKEHISIGFNIDEYSLKQDTWKLESWIHGALNERLKV